MRPGVITSERGGTVVTRDETHETFASRLKLRLRQLGLWRTDLERATGVSKSTAQRWLNGENIPGIQEALDIAKLLGVKVEYLFDERVIDPEPEPGSGPGPMVLRLHLQLGKGLVLERLTLVPSPVPLAQEPAQEEPSAPGPEGSEADGVREEESDDED